MKGIVVRFLVLGAFVSGCSASDTLTPDSLAGLYVLTDANSGGLPFVLDNTQYSRSTLISESLLFDGPDSLTRTRTIRIDDLTKGTTTNQTFSFRQAFRIDGTNIAIGWFSPCPPDAICIGNDTGKASTSRISTTSLLNGGARLTYQRTGLIN